MVKQKFYIHLLLMAKKMYCSSIDDKREFGLYEIFIHVTAICLCPFFVKPLSKGSGIERLIFVPTVTAVKGPN